MPESNREKNHAYILAVQNALFTFQMIEESLKICVGLSYKIIKHSVPPPTAFNFDASNINNAPLGKLIQMFSGVTANLQLVGELRKIMEWRNFCAHRAYTHEFMSRRGSAPVSSDDVEDVQAATTFGVNLVEQVASEMRALQKAHFAVFGVKGEQGA
ncbi:MAG: hypothetical protein ACXW11_05890 [Methylotenera sp.]